MDSNSEDNLNFLMKQQEKVIIEAQSQLDYYQNEQESYKIYVEAGKEEILRKEKEIKKLQDVLEFIKSHMKQVEN